MQYAAVTASISDIGLVDRAAGGLSWRDCKAFSSIFLHNCISAKSLDEAVVVRNADHNWRDLGDTVRKVVLHHAKLDSLS